MKTETHRQQFARMKRQFKARQAAKARELEKLKQASSYKDAKAIHDFVASGTVEDLVRIVGPVELHKARLELGL